MSISYQGIDGTNRAAFNAKYWAVQDSRVAALQLMDPVTRYNTAYALALKGVAIDGDVHVRSTDPFLTHWERHYIDNAPWGPSVLQPNIQDAPLEPGQAANPPFVPYDRNNPAPGSIYYFDPNNLSDPRLTPPPAPPPPPPNTPVTPVPKPGDILVGAPKGAGLYDLTPLGHTFNLMDGFTWFQNNHTYLLHVAEFALTWQQMN
jgi:hypothetical protein